MRRCFVLKYNRKDNLELIGLGIGQGVMLSIAMTRMKLHVVISAANVERSVRRRRMKERKRLVVLDANSHLKLRSRLHVKAPGILSPKQ
jgi:hypothetical protein